MTQILKGRFDASKTATRPPPAQPDFLTERYSIDAQRRRVLLGLTWAETKEFETLDSLPPSEGDRIAWTFGGKPTTNRERRWLQLYTRHNEAWQALKQGNGARRQPTLVS